MSTSVEAWLEAVLDRHVEPMGRPAFLKAVRALSARYVERRNLLPERSAIDSAGKRAAFAGFFAPLHFMATLVIVREMKLHQAPIETVVDLGCGTGAAGAAWAVALDRRPALTGIDVNPWAVTETNWSWRTLGLNGHARRGDLVKATLRLRQVSRRTGPGGTAIVLAWTVNELSLDARRALLPLLLDLAREGASVLVVEPVARRVTPWWDEWEAAFGEARGVAQEWPMGIELEAPFAQLDRDAGFRRDALGARSLSIRGHSDRNTITGSTRAARRAGR